VPLRQIAEEEKRGKELRVVQNARANEKIKFFLKFFSFFFSKKENGLHWAEQQPSRV